MVCLLLTPLPLSKGKKQAYASSRGTTNLLSSDCSDPVFMLEGHGAPLPPRDLSSEHTDASHGTFKNYPQAFRSQPLE